MYNVCQNWKWQSVRQVYISNSFAILFQMVAQFSDSCEGCDKTSMKQKDLAKFVQKFHALSKDEIACELMVPHKSIFSMLAQMVPCVGCRRRYSTQYHIPQLSEDSQSEA